MPSSFQRLAPRGDLSLRARRPPGEYVALLSQSEREFRSYINALETDPMFDQLVRDGALVKVRLQGRVPRERYEEFMDRQLVAFLNEYGIAERAGWEADFLGSRALQNAEEIAARYDAPLGLVRRFLRYLKSVGADYAPRGLNGNAPPDIETAGGASPVDLTDTIERTRAFVEQYEVSEQEFLNSVLGGASAEELAAQFGCSLLEAEAVLEDADRVYLAENWETSAPVAAHETPVVADEIVASVRVEEGRLAVQFHHDSVYTQRYLIPQEGDKESEAAHDLLLRARYVNQRLSVLSRLVRQLCDYQIEFLESGDARRLKPLAQAELARRLGEHPSTVSRLLRGKKIETSHAPPHDTLSLSFLCQSKTDVVARLVAAHPRLTDQAVVSKLREDYDCQIARRTVAYHRAKRLRRNKRRQTAAQAAKPK